MKIIKECVDILTELGGVTTAEAAQGVIEKKADKENLDKLSRIKHPEILKKIANAIVLCEPDSLFINTASEKDRQFVRLHKLWLYW